ncbi:MAG TPA: SDR family NAD(P)-dependent oxidoreductase [Mycobacterium sp.]|nr:SDR family NAD(P)-dependent oxidoreductase [Mycobacterium sp.]
MGKLDGKVAVITGGSSGMALAGAKLFVVEGAHVFISGRRQEALDEAVNLLGPNVTGVQADSANLDDLDRLFDAVRREKAAVDVLWTSAGTGEERKLGEITEQHFDDTFGLNARGTVSTLHCGCRETAPAGSQVRADEIDRGIRQGLAAQLPGLPGPAQPPQSRP